jgi:ribosomal protein S26
MAKYIKCDRCGEMIPGDTSYVAKLTSPYPWELTQSKEYDLCVKCATSFRRFFDNEDVIALNYSRYGKGVSHDHVSQR